MISAVIRIEDQATPTLRRLQRGLADRRELDRRVAGHAERLTRDYIRTTGDDRHATARRLGATPTLHYIRAAQSVRGEATRDGAMLTLRGAIFARVDRDVRVAPRAAKYLTIPANRLAYGRRAREIGGLRVVRLRTGRLALARVTGGEAGLRSLMVFYWLVKAVTLRRDRTLLPSDAAYGQTMEQAAKEYAQDLIQSRNQQRGLA